MLKQVKGNLITLAEQGKFDVIVHGCNCQTTMGSGIAKEIRERYPEAYITDINYDQTYGKERRYLKLGNFSEVEVYPPKGKFKIVNAYTQHNFMPRGVDHFEYTSFQMILEKLLYFYGNYDFGFPYIGMGLAGGDPKRILTILENFAINLGMKGGSATLVEFV